MNWLNFLFIVFVIRNSGFYCLSPADIEKLHRNYTKTIVEGINKYRDNLMCSNPVIGLRHISSCQSLTNKSKDILNTKNWSRYNGTQITIETCNHQINKEYSEIQEIESFLGKCEDEAKPMHNMNVSWLWDPEIHSIGCVFNYDGSIFIFCILNEVNRNSGTDIKIEKPRFVIDEAEKRTDLFTNTCNVRKILFSKSCYLHSFSRSNIIADLNKFRDLLAVFENYTNLKYVQWDYDLEMVASVLIQFENPSENLNNCFKIRKFRSRIDLYYHQVHHTALNDTNLIVNLIKEISGKAINESKNSSLNATRTYGWMYDAQFRAIGCAFSKDSRDSGLVLCLFNRDLAKRFNLKRGPQFCADCKCEIEQYPNLCSDEHSKYKKVQDTFGFTKIDWYIGFCLNVLLYLTIIGVIVFIRSVQHYEYQRFLFNYDCGDVICN